MDTTTPKNLWDFLEETECGTPDTRDLFQWSLNYEAGNRPFELFLDIIQYSADNFGTDLYDGRFRSIGYMEADYLADALKEWAQYPQQVENWITELFNCEDN